ncbi:MAG TPA: DUF222 domain-containing protein [Acidimicrobiales bacterium]|nr:DUF222 domain-containing protein [Acidimicrobiales bacterium]
MIDGLEAVLEELGAAEPQALSDPEAIERLHRCLARLEAVTTRAAAAFDASGAWQARGARSAAAWLSVQCGLAPASAQRRVHLGRALRHLPAAEAAWTAGEVDSSHVALLARARTPATEEAMAGDEAVLVGQAKAMRFSHFVRALAYWRYRADRDGGEGDARRVRDERRFHLSRTFGGTYVGDLVLDPIAGTVVAEALRRIEDELFTADRAEARQRRGDDAMASDLRRTPAQRRADALVEMARRAGTAPADGRRPEPCFSVLVGYETFAGPLCELADGTVVTPGSLVEWLGEAWVERVVFDGPSRVIDVGVARRLFTGATRRAVEVRDRECYHPTCDEPAGRCQVDHVEPWSAGGRTVAANGRPACGFHNRARHRGPPPGA